MSMHFTSLASFFHMGGYGAYVWPAYGATAVVLVAQAVIAWRGHRRALKQREQA